MVDSTGNTPHSTSTHLVHYIFAEDVYTNLEQISAKEAMDISSNKNVPKQIMPVTIMVVDTISSVKSRILLKVLLDSGSTTTMINRKCLHRNCKTCKISNSRKISTLAGSYTSSEIVVLCYLRPLSLTKTAMWTNKKHSCLIHVSILVTPVLVHKKDFLFLNSLKGFWRSLAETS
jgi:hypothetical protein